MDHLNTWIEIGNQNPWISSAIDPCFGKDSFNEMRDRDELIRHIHHGNWCLGMGLVLGDLCFIQQVNGGDEWLAIRGDVRFESISLQHILRTKGHEAIYQWLDRVEKATDEQLRNLDY